MAPRRTPCAIASIVNLVHQRQALQPDVHLTWFRLKFRSQVPLTTDPVLPSGRWQQPSGMTCCACFKTAETVICKQSRV
ncbi:hypothetical protein CTAM01_05245 [Colletotrichum tamarilloi]|uniref:Uncharacterized protein n=1 Tax=Colletotrichum tamarilloi TaxID=1209934 RepID=A0ABQ9RF54_9PEZI|nr:uncharacterized protein CTAM01_05245 [Colletotrichum tamarilloi]KAK1502432.1 hypothetical protein CTAM01_05245 [Colletotrichum tamarilloi]